MGTRLTPALIMTFLESARLLADRRSLGIMVLKRDMVMGGRKLGSHARRHRLLEKYGYMKREEMGKHDVYTLTLRGLGLYDYYNMQIRELLEPHELYSDQES